MTGLITEDTKIRVSSVLNRDATNFGKKHLTDGSGDTCWNSDQGSPQWICIDFSAPVTPSEVHLQFQGGFAGKEVQIETGSDGPSSGTIVLKELYPEDNNALQVSPGAGQTSHQAADSVSLKHRYVWQNCGVSSGGCWQPVGSPARWGVSSIKRMNVSATVVACFRFKN